MSIWTYNERSPIPIEVFQSSFQHTQIVFRSRKNSFFQFRSIARYQKITEAALIDSIDGTIAVCAPTLLFVNTAHSLPRDARHIVPTRMIFTGDLENIAEPNLGERSIELTFYDAMFLGGPRRFPRNRPKTIRQTNDSTFILFFFSFRNFIILLMSDEAEAGSAEERPCQGIIGSTEITPLFCICIRRRSFFFPRVIPVANASQNLP